MKKGFTLIELLVVIAIIGILSSVVLASLNSARNKGEDAAVKANLSNIRAQAEIVYDNTGNYADVCEDATVARGVSAANGQCFDDSDTATNDGWAAYAPLSSDPDVYFCVDYKGNAATTTTGAISTTDVVCK